MTECTKKNCRWLVGIVFFLSLALNVFLGGWLFGSGKIHEPRGRPMFFDVFNDKAATLPEQERTAVNEVLNRYQPQMRKQMKRIMKSREAIDSTFKRDDYTRAEAEERFSAMQEQSLAMQELMQAMMLDLADVLPPERRAQFMERPKELRGKGEEFKAKPKPKTAVLVTP